jgi:hypothetical protein
MDTTDNVVGEQQQCKRHGNVGRYADGRCKECRKVDNHNCHLNRQKKKLEAKANDK